MEKKYPNCKSLSIMAQLKFDQIVPKETKDKDLLDIQLKNIHKLDEDVSDVVEYKIPPIIHMVWVTSPENPSEIEDKYIEILQNNVKLLSHNRDVDWQFILWTNNPALIPHTAEMLSSSGVLIKPISELITAQDLLHKIYDLIDQHYYALASNAIRYSALRDHGGTYIDTDYELFKVLYKLMKTFDFVAGHIHPVPICPENNMIMAKPHHPILEEMISILRTNLLDFENSSEYVKHACHLRHETAILGGSAVISSAFYRRENQDGNIDIVFGDKVITDDRRYSIEGSVPEDPYSEDYDSSNVPLFGRDHYAGRWFEH